MKCPICNEERIMCTEEKIEKTSKALKIIWLIASSIISVFMETIGTIALTLLIIFCITEHIITRKSKTKITCMNCGYT